MPANREEVEQLVEWQFTDSVTGKPDWQKISKALREPQGEPVGWPENRCPQCGTVQPLFDAPAARQPDEQLEKARKDAIRAANIGISTFARLGTYASLSTYLQSLWNELSAISLRNQPDTRQPEQPTSMQVAWCPHGNWSALTCEKCADARQPDADPIDLSIAACKNGAAAPRPSQAQDDGQYDALCAARTAYLRELKAALGLDSTALLQVSAAFARGFNTHRALASPPAAVGELQRCSVCSWPDDGTCMTTCTYAKAEAWDRGASVPGEPK